MSQNLLRFAKTINDYRRIKAGENAERSCRFGVRAMVLAVLFALLSVAIPFLFELSGESGFTPIIAVLALIIVAAMLFLLLIWMILYVTLQLKLNRRAIGFVALLFLLAAIAAAVVITLVFSK